MRIASGRASACPPRPSGRRRLVEQTGVYIRGGMRPRQKHWPILTTAVIFRTMGPCVMWDLMSMGKARMGPMIWRGMRGNGWRIGTMRRAISNGLWGTNRCGILRGRTRANSGFCAGVLGTTPIPGSYDRPSASGSTRRTGATASGFVVLRAPRNPWFFGPFPLGPFLVLSSSFSKEVSYGDDRSSDGGVGCL